MRMNWLHRSSTALPGQARMGGRGACIAMTHLYMYSMLWSFMIYMGSPCAPIFELTFVVVLP